MPPPVGVMCDQAEPMTGSGARTPCAPARMAAQRRAQAQKPWTAGPSPSREKKTGIKESCRNSDRIAFIELDASIFGIRLSDCLHRNVHAAAPAAPVEGAGSA